LDIDLSGAIGGRSQNHLRHLLESEEGYDKTNERRLSEGWVTTNNGGTAYNSKPSQNYEWYENENPSSKPQQQEVVLDPLYSLSTVKDALQQTATGGDKKNLSEYIRSLMVEYTTDYVTSFAFEALRSTDRTERGWDVVHAVDLRGNILDVTFFDKETHFIEGSYNKDNNTPDQEETFASLTFGFSGTAAILKGSKMDGTIEDTYTSVGAIHNRPVIGADELRLMVRAAFAPPDGPYEYLTYVLDESIRDGKDFIPAKMSYEDSLAHDATILLGGSREATIKTDMDYSEGNSPFVSSTLTYVGVGSENAERRESIATFVQGLYLVVFLGGFYLYASYKFRRNHLKQELMKYGEGAILVKSGEKTLFSPESKSKSRFQFISKWLKYNQVRNASSPSTMETLEEDGFFGSESFDSDYNERDLEIGLKESYDKAGLDMTPLDSESYFNYNSSSGFNTMKPVDDDMKENLQSSSLVGGLSENMLVNVLESVVPIPAKDDENATYLLSNKGRKKTKKKSLSGCAGSIIVQRRYVQPAAPLEVLYGAAFLHGEAERVEAQRKLHKKKKIRASPSGRNRVKKKKKATTKLVAQAMSGQRAKHAVNPMMTITESIDEIAEDYDSEEEDLIAPAASFYSPSNFMRNLSEWILGAEVSDDDEGSSPASTAAEVVSATQPTLKNEGNIVSIMYRDEPEDGKKEPLQSNFDEGMC
jgi:hypothetical protein